MGSLLVALVIGILLAPCLDPASVWICLPLTLLLGFADSRCVPLAVSLVGAGVASLQPSVPPHPGDTAVRLTGTLERAPEWRGLGTYLDVRLQSVDAQAYRGRVRLTEFLDDPNLRGLFDALDLGCGDRVEIVVKLHRPVVYRNPGVFDFRRHLEREGIYWTGTIRNPRLITVLGRGWHGPDRIRKWIRSRLESHFGNDRTIQGLVMGMVLGRKYGLTAESERQFQAGGLYHLVVVSGFNLAVVAGAAFALGRRFLWARTIRLLFVLGCALGYSSIVDGQAPVLRATLMVCFLITGRLLDRGYAPLNTIAATAFVILLINPAAIEDASFQMTFAAVTAVVLIGVPATSWALGWLREALGGFTDPETDGRISVRAADWRAARRAWCELHGLPTWIVTFPWNVFLVAGETLIISVCVELVFAFFMVESFHRVAPISPLLNVPAGMITAAVTPLGLLLIFLPEPAAAFAAAIIKILLSVLLWILNLGLSLPGATLRVPSAPPVLWFVYAVTILAFAASIQKKWPAICLASLIGIFSFQLLITLGNFSPRPPDSVTMTFLDVGQGDSSLIEFPSGQRMLIDGGGVSAGRFLNLRDESTFSIGENVVSAHLFSRRIRRLDVVVLTHAHNDHMDGLLDVIENFEVGEFWLGRNPMSARYRALLERIQEKQIPIRWVAAGQTIGEVSVLHPPANWIPHKNGQNNDSVVLLLHSGAGTALLTGDIEQRIPVPDRIDVLKVPHHGSRGVRIRPQAKMRVISVGANNPFGHPDRSALPALRTDQLGAITIRLARSGPQADTSLTGTCYSCKLTMLYKPLITSRP
jgi:competence protein ComEC